MNIDLFVGEFRAIYDKGINGTVIGCCEEDGVEMLVIRDGEGKHHTAKLEDTCCLITGGKQVTNHYYARDRLNNYR